MIAFIIGVALAIVLIIFGKLTGYEKDRSFFPTLLIIIASYYLLFATLTDSVSTLLIEIAVTLFFAVIAVWGSYKIPVLVGAGIVLHGLFDFSYGHFYINTGVPVFWPAFCAGIDIPFGLWVMYFSYKTLRREVPYVR
jgi:hypothetical protein